MIKNVVFDIEVRESLKRGVDTLSNAVKETLGARGKHVLCTDFKGDPFLTKDGVTVAEDINLEDPLENMGCQLVKKVASDTNRQAGDGTTTATVLAQAIIENSYKNIASGANPVLIKKGIDLATEQAVTLLNKMSTPVGSSKKSLKNVATISANNDEDLGEIISTAYKRVGKEGVVVVKDSPTTNTYVDYSEGTEFESGYISPYFINNEEEGVIKTGETVVVLFDEILSNNNQLAKIIPPIMENEENKGKSILIIAEDIEGEALSTLIVNNMNMPFTFTAIKAPKYGFDKIDFLEDLAVITGGKVISKQTGDGLDSIDSTFFGTVDYVKITSEKTTIETVIKDKQRVINRINTVKSQMKDTSSESRKRELSERLSRLSEGVATIMVGAKSEVEAKEKKDRVEDAVNATRAALEEGIVEGGGVALLRIFKSLRELPIPSNESDVQLGWKILVESLKSPIVTIIKNGGYTSPDVVVNEILKSDLPIGYDIRMEEYVNMKDKGIVDPKKVTRCALENASSIAGMIITVNCALVDKGSKILDGTNKQNLKTELL